MSRPLDERGRLVHSTRRSFLALSALTTGAIGVPSMIPAPSAHAAPPQVSFELSGTPAAQVELALVCTSTGAGPAVELTAGAGPVQVPLDLPPGSLCEVRVTAVDPSDSGSEVDITVSSGGSVWARRAGQLEDGSLTGADVVVPDGDVQVSVHWGDQQPHGTALRVMQFNIFRSGVLEGQLGAGPDGPQRNLEELIEFIAAEDPEVVFMTEVYGSGEAIRDGLNALRPDTPRFEGLQITTGATGPSKDNLWIFTTLPVLEVYPSREGGELSDFNFGGARLGLPDGRHVHAFAVWLYHVGGAADALDHAALEEQHGLARTMSDDEVISTDRDRRLAQARTLLQDRLPSYVSDDAPVIIGGDFNTAPARDWTAQFAKSPGHAGLVLPWPVTQLFDEAGFVDTYREANADAGRYSGRTWSPLKGYTYGPMRMDFIYSRGDAVRVLASHTCCERLPQHRGTQLDLAYPFYSDHCAVVSDLLIRGGSVAAHPRPYESDDPTATDLASPAEPSGRPVPPSELTATSDVGGPGKDAARAVDGDITTLWDDADPPALPHTITLDLQRVRRLSALRYQPRVTGNTMGTITQATVELSPDGTTWQSVGDFSWAWDRLAKNVDLEGRSARYIRLANRWGLDFISGTGGFTTAAEITPYEQV